MPDVRIAIIKEYEVGPGQIRKPGDIVKENDWKARQLVMSGHAVYYADFSESMLKKAESEKTGKPEKASKGAKADKAGEAEVAGKAGEEK